MLDHDSHGIKLSLYILDEIIEHSSPPPFFAAITYIYTKY